MKTKLLLLGLGRWGANHLRVLQSLPIELYVADPDAERLEASGLPPQRCAADPRTLFAAVDAAVVVTPAPTHFDLCRELLSLGKDVFVEKPITVHSHEARELCELAEERGRILQVGHIFRFDPASRWLRSAVACGRFGRIKMLRGSFSGFKRPRSDTGVTYADSIHFVDLFNFLLGEPPRRVHAVLNDFLGRGMDDQSFLSLEYGNGSGAPVWATVEAGYHLPGKLREVVVAGEELTAVCDYNVAQYKIRTVENRHIASGGGEVRAVSGAVNQLEFPPEEPLRAELAAFLDSIATRKPPLADGWAGYESVRVLEAALHSSAGGNWTALDPEESLSPA